MSRFKENVRIPLLVKSVVAIAMMGFLLFAANERLDSQFSGIAIKIKTRGDKKQLITKEEVGKIISESLGYNIKIASLKDIDLFELESKLSNDDRISRAEMYVSKQGVLVVGILQNLPIARVEITGGKDYYLDPTGKKIEKVGEVVRVPVVTGSVSDYIDNYREIEGNNLNYVFDIVSTIYEDDFLSALVDQVHITADNEAIIIPTLGRQHIMLGATGGLDEKLYKLKGYYEEGMKNIGIDKFKGLNLSYEGQIIGVNDES